MLSELSDKMYNRLMSYPQEVMLQILMEAIDHMQTWNGRTATTCVCLALGAEEVQTSDGNVNWIIPSREDVLALFGYKEEAS